MQCVAGQWRVQGTRAGWPVAFLMVCVLQQAQGKVKAGIVGLCTGVLCAMCGRGTLRGLVGMCTAGGVRVSARSDAELRGSPCPAPGGGDGRHGRPFSRVFLQIPP